MKHKSVLVLLVVFCSLLSVKVNAIYYCRDGFSYNIDMEAKTAAIARPFSSKDSIYAKLQRAYIRAGVTYNNVYYPVTSIESSAFEGCQYLNYLYIPKTIKNIGHRAIAECPQLTTIVVERGNPQFDNRNNCNAVIETSTNTLVLGCKNSVIPNTITTIGEFAFDGCVGVEKLVIPESITKIERFAFAYSDITEIILPNTITSIEKSAFQCCKKLLSINIPNSVEKIGEAAFSSCSALETAVFGNSIDTIKRYCFSHCESLRKISIPDKVISIDKSAFAYCDSLVTITIGKGLKNIEENVFYRFDTYKIRTFELKGSNPPVFYSNTFGTNEKDIVYVPCNSVENYASINWGGFKIFIEKQYQYCILANSEQYGYSQCNGNHDCGYIVIEAKPKKDCRFIRWNDGNTDNPRNIELTQDTIFTAYFANRYAGQCGDNLYWRYSDKTLYITGQGKMWNFATAEEQPWALLRDSVYTLTFENGVTYVGDNAFRGLQRIAKVVFPVGLTGIGTSAFEQCIRLEDISFGADVADIGDRAFAGCSRVVDMTVYSTATPEITENTFDGVSSYAYLNVIENCMRKFQIHPYWSRFTLKAIGAETTDDDKFVVDPGTTDADFTWPQNDQAYTYSLEIKKDGEVFCTLTFNAQGQLVGIAFAPGRDGNRPVPAATKVRGGYKFTVTGLSEGSYYRYTFETATEEGKVVDSYRGDFRTNGTTATGQIQTAILPTKTLRNGQVVIRKNGKTYDVLGKQIE